MILVETSLGENTLIKDKMKIKSAHQQQYSEKDGVGIKPVQ